MTQIIIYDKNLRWMKDILEKWQEIHQDFSDEWRDIHDGPFWHIERPQVSVLAGAVWLSGGLALEEFQSPKGSPSERWEGQTDLALTFGQGSEKRKCAVEAKADCWVDITETEDRWNDKVRDRLQKAVNGTRETLAGDDKGQYSEGLAVLFIVPHQYGRIRKGRLEKFEKWLYNKSHDLGALVGSVTDPLDDKKDYQYKNIYMAIKRVSC